MTTWTDIFPDLDGPPVTGLPSEFSAVARGFSTMHDDAIDIVDQFSRIMGSGTFDEIQGAVAEPFKKFVDNVSDRLKSLPDVSQSAAGIFNNHATQLDGFRTAAATALAQAVTKWHERNTAKTQLGTATTAADNLKKQIDNAPPDPDPSASTSTALKTQHDTATTHVTNLTTQLGTLDTELQAFRKKWNDLHGDEQHLRSDTKGKLDDIDLHSLEDPGFWGSIYEDATGFLKWAYNFTGLEDLVGLIDAIAHGDWAAALWRLRDVLDKLFVVLSIVALVVAPELLLVVIAVMAVVKLGIDVGLYASNTPDPATGRRISLVDIGFDVFDAVTAGKASAAHEASTLSKGRELYQSRSTFVAGRKAAMAKTPVQAGEATKYTKRAIANQQKLLTKKFGLDSTRTVLEQGKKKALYTLSINTPPPRFVIGATQHVAKPIAVGLYGVGQGHEAARGPSTEDIDQSMDTDAPRPYFTRPSSARLIDIFSEIPIPK